MHLRALVARLPLVLPLLLPACADPGLAPEDPPVASKFELHELLIVPLIPAEPDVYVLEIDDGVDPQLLADRLGVELERTLGENLVVVSGVPNETLLDDGDIVLFENNQEAGLALGQELTMGFYEGHEFEMTDLAQNTALRTVGITWGQNRPFGVDIRVAVLDTGVDPDHELLRGKISPPQNLDEIGYKEDPNGIDDDDDGLIDEAYGHGTFVAGVISQVAPGATIVPMRVLNSDGFGSLADVLTALDVMEEEDIQVINLSLSLSSFSGIFEKRLVDLAAQGILVVAASGNGGSITAYPASSVHTVGVAAMEAPTLLASFSNVGPDCAIAAPGTYLLSSAPENQLAWGTGTSFATPVIAAAFAIVLDFGLPTEILWQFTNPLPPLQHGELNLLVKPPGRTGRMPWEFSDGPFH